MKKVIFFNGLPGSGKLTIANLLANKTGAKVIDNHHVNNLIFGIKEFDADVPSFVWKFIDEVKSNLYATLAKLEQTEDYILTGCLVTGADPNLQMAKDFAKNLNAELIVINLVCSQDKILDRINTQDRVNRRKLTDIEVYKRVIDEEYMSFPENSQTIDNSHQNPLETFIEVCKILKVKV
tara:strand:+ start:2815 stop:3354 length:540 start_codon:yes stop_codon:yes gene_type:complete